MSDVKRTSNSLRLPGVETPRLPLCRGVVFVDWHGVMSSTVFWSSIVENPSHPFHARLSEAVDNLFMHERELVRDWMRGEIGYKDIINRLNIELDARTKVDYLERRLLSDCSSMPVSQGLVSILKKMRRDCWIVLATDNMDCFRMAAEKSLYIRATFDAVLCSSELGLMKTDSVMDFFGEWLRLHNLQFENSVLIDDCPETCFEFRRLGGAAIIVNDIDEAIDSLHQWHGRSAAREHTRRAH